MNRQTLTEICAQIARIHWPVIGPSDAARLAHGSKS